MHVVACPLVEEGEVPDNPAIAVFSREEGIGEDVERDEDAGGGVEDQQTSHRVAAFEQDTRPGGW